MTSSAATTGAAARTRIAVALVVVAQALGTSLWFSPSGAAAGLMASLGIDGAGFGWLVAATQLGFIAGTLAFAASGLADRWPASRICAASCLAGAAANAAVAVPGLGYEAAWALRFAVGLCLAGIYPLGMKLIVQWVGARPAAALGWLVGMLTLGTALPHGLRAGGTEWPWQAVLLATSALAVVAAAIVGRLGDGPHAPPRARSPAGRPADGAASGGALLAVPAPVPPSAPAPDIATAGAATAGVATADVATADAATADAATADAVTADAITADAVTADIATAGIATTGIATAGIATAGTATTGIVRRVFAIRGFRASAFGYFGHMWELYAFWSVVPWLCRPLADALAPAGAAAGSATVAALAFAVIAAGAIGCVAGGAASRRVGSARVAAAALAGSGLMCAAYPLLPESAPALRLAALLFWGLCVVADSPQFSALSAQNVPAAWLGSALTLQNGIGFAITVASIVLLAHALPAWGDAALWLLVPGPVFGLLALRPLLRSRP